MKLSRPKFWRKRNLVSYILYPLSFLYYVGFTLKSFFVKPQIFDVPIICVGNIVVGGTGKTPFILKLIDLLKSKYKIAVISKGYGGNFTEICRKVKNDKPEIVGDEPLLLAKNATTYVTKSRKIAITKAMKDGANLIILDDGFQDFSIKKTINLICFDGEYGVGNGFILPAGPLRESFRAKDIDSVILIGADRKKIGRKIKNRTWHLNFNLQTKLAKKQKYVAFAGIGNPDKFFNFLKNEKLELVSEISFPDHHKYSEAELNELITLAEKNDAKLLTTSKDMIKIPDKLSKKFIPVEVSLEFAKNDTEFKKYLFDLIENKQNY